MSSGTWAGWVVAAAAALAAFAFAWAFRRSWRRIERLERDRVEIARQLDRRISEIFSLQEISFILSASLEVERIVGRVAQYTTRFLQTDGALIALIDEGGARLRVEAAEGTLAPLLGRELTEADSRLVLEAMGRERIELAHREEGGPAILIGDIAVDSAAVAPLRAHGVTTGALVAADRRTGPFSTEDLWLLSTVATQTAVVVANSRFVDMIRRGKDEWETAFNALAEGIAVVGPNGQIQRANRALARLVGSRESELLGQYLSAIMFGPSEAAAELLNAVRRGDQPGEITITSPRNGRTLRLAAAPLPGPGPGPAASAVVLVDDVTEQRALEAQLIQNEKLAAVGQLVSGVAHELNNPLTSISGLSELLLEQGHLSTPEREHLRVIHEQAERSNRIVRNLLTFARKGAPERNPVDLNDLVARTSLLIAYELKLRGIQLDQALLGEPVMVLGDRYELQQVLLNLITNAIQALETREDEGIRRIRLETQVTLAAEAELTVIDNGPGIAPELRGQLFTPFFTTKEAGKGTGLGLSISYGIVRSHGGRLIYRPGGEAGCEFTMVLPHAALPAEPTPPAQRPAEPQSSGRVLLVDDDPAAHRIVSAVFQREGMEVVWARTAEHGMELARDPAVSLVIAESRSALPDGTPFVPALHLIHPNLAGRIIIGESAPGSPGPGAETSARLAKPYNPRELLDLASALLTPA